MSKPPPAPTDGHHQMQPLHLPFPGDVGRSSQPQLSTSTPHLPEQTPMPTQQHYFGHGRTHNASSHVHNLHHTSYQSGIPPTSYYPRAQWPYPMQSGQWLQQPNYGVPFPNHAHSSVDMSKMMSADSLESNIDAPTTGSFEHSADASTRIDVDSSVSNDSGRTVTATTTNIAVSPKLHAVVSTEDSVDNNTEDEFYVSKRYLDLAALTTSVDMYSVNEKVELGLKITKTPCSRVENATHYRWTCKRSGSHKSTAKTRIGRVSLKCGCTCRITATHPLDPSSNGKRLKCVEIAAVSLGHTNGCLGPADTEMNFAVKMRAGRKYTDVFLAHVTREVKMGRYSTRDVKSCLVEYGYRDATLAEATNLRYRIKTGLPIKGWTKEDSKNDAEIGMMEDYLYREELGNLVRKDPKQAVRDLAFMHKGLEQQVPGYMYDIATDSENRFTGTAWQTGQRGQQHLSTSTNCIGLNSDGALRGDLTTLLRASRPVQPSRALSTGSRIGSEGILKHSLELFSNMSKKI